MKNTSKKGEITSGTLIIIIIAIVSLVAILILFFNLNLGKVTDQEVCHYSVVARASAIAANNLLKDTLPLNCKTQYVCITEDGDCGKLISPEIEKVKSKKEVYEALTTQLVDCWWMFGEGQVDYLGKEVIKAGSLYCSLCSQVAFDDSLTSLEGLESGEIDREDFFHYLNIEYKDEVEKISYWNYLYGESGIDDLTNAVPAGIDNTEKVVSFCDSFCKLEDAFNFCSSSTILTKSDGSVFIGSCYALSKTADSGIDNCIKLSCPKNRLNEEVTLYEESGIDEITNAVPAGIDNTEKVVSVCDSFCNLDDASFCFSPTVLTKSDGSKLVGSCYALSKTADSGIDNCIKLSCVDNGLNEEVTISTPQKISNFGKINFDSHYYVIMGSVSKSDLNPWLVAGGAALVALPVGAVTGGTLFLALAMAGTGGGLTYIGQIIEGESEQQFLHPTIIEANSEEFELLKCKDVNTIG